MQNEKKKKKEEEEKESRPFFPPNFWVGRKRANKHIFFRPYHDIHPMYKLLFLRILHTLKITSN